MQRYASHKLPQKREDTTPGASAKEKADESRAVPPHSRRGDICCFDFTSLHESEGKTNFPSSNEEGIKGWSLMRRPTQPLPRLTSGQVRRGSL